MSSKFGALELKYCLACFRAVLFRRRPKLLTPSAQISGKVLAALIRGGISKRIPIWMEKLKIYSESIWAAFWRADWEGNIELVPELMEALVMAFKVESRGGIAVPIGIPEAEWSNPKGGREQATRICCDSPGTHDRSFSGNPFKDFRWGLQALIERSRAITDIHLKQLTQPNVTLLGGTVV